MVWYYLDEFAEYKADTGEDAHSILASRVRRSSIAANRDFHLLSNSAGDRRRHEYRDCTTDYDGTARPQGAGYDIGAYEYITLPMVTGVLVASSAWSSSFLNSLGGVGYAIPDGPNQLLPLPGGNLNEIIIEFNENVNVTEGDLTLTGVNVPSYAFSAFSYDAVNHRATWTVSQNLSRDKLLVDLDGSTANAVTDVAGNRLDGEWTNPTWSPPAAPRGRRLAVGQRHGWRRLPIPHQRPAGRRQPGRHGERAGLGRIGGELSEKPQRLGQRRLQLRRRGGRSRTWPFWPRTTGLGFRLPSRSRPRRPCRSASRPKPMAAATPVVLSSSTTNGGAHIPATASRLGKVTSAHRHIFHLMGDVEYDGVSDR